MTDSKTPTLHCSVTEVTCRRCGMSFRVSAPDGLGWAPRGEKRRSSGTTICAEPGCSVPFWHRSARVGPTKVGVYPADVVAHRASWLSDIEAGDAA
jgi:hypothetical protein